MYATKSRLSGKKYFEKWFAPPPTTLKSALPPPPPTFKNVLPPPANAEQVYASSIAWSLILCVHHNNYKEDAENVQKCKSIYPSNLG